MEKTTIFTLRCAKCGKEEIVARPIIFEADEHPAEAAQIKDETYFTVRCSACGERQAFLMNMLYVSRKQRFMIALQPKEDMPFPAEAPEGYTLRVVRDAEDLADKLRALESGMDDRVIELAKLELYKKIRPALPAGSVMGMPAFHVSEDGSKISLPMNIEGKGYAMGTDKLTAGRLAELSGIYAAALEAHPMKGFCVIDRAWAEEVIRMKNEEGSRK